MVINVLASKLEEMHLSHLIAPDVLAQLEDDELGEYMSWVNDVVEGRAIYLPAEARIPFAVVVEARK